MSATSVGARPTALVTGASGGIGADLAALLAADGHDLVLVARSTSALESLGAQLSARHAIRATCIAADLSVDGAADALVRELTTRGLTIDVLVNNAGVGLLGSVVDNDPDRELAMLRLNVLTLYRLTKLLVPAMVARRRGAVLDVASTAAFVPGPFMAVYYATKAFVLSFSQALAEELSGTGVTVTTLCPGPTHTGFGAQAGASGARLFQGPFVMRSADVARAGYSAMRRGERLVIPGATNKLSIAALRLAPRALVLRLVRRIQQAKRA